MFHYKYSQPLKYWKKNTVNTIYMNRVAVQAISNFYFFLLDFLALISQNFTKLQFFKQLWHRFPL